jgi:hypothetical protein
MNQVLTTVPAHFDGQQIQLDVNVQLKPNARLLITILPEEITYEQMLRDVMKVSEPSFARVWDNDEDALYDDL